MLRSNLIEELGLGGDEEVVAEAKEKFKKFQTDPSSLSADLKEPIYKISIKYGGEEEYNAMLNYGKVICLF